MKVCYVDESGNQNSDPCLVMVGIVVDASRLHRTRQEFAAIFDSLQTLFEENLKEIKGSKLIFGKDRWRKVDPEKRKQIAGGLCDWISTRKHRLALSSICRSRHKKSLSDNIPIQCHDEWLSAGIHIALQLQKAHKAQDNNKGHTFLIFDDNKKKADALSDVLWMPPAWTDDYYGKTKKQERLDQVIDSAFMIKSHFAGLVQVADLYAFIFRRYAEVLEYNMPEEWDGERDLLVEYVSSLSERLLPRSTRWPKTTSSPAAKWFNSVAPESLRVLGK